MPIGPATRDSDPHSTRDEWSRSARGCQPSCAARVASARRLVPRLSDVLDQPLRFDRILLNKVWGGRELERCPGIALPVAGPIGESWELVDRDDHNSVLQSDGSTLRALVRRAGTRLLGKAPA